MIKNFEEVKQQLREFAEIVNSYKSEAVQLRLVELVLGREGSGADEEEDEERKPPPRKRGPTRRSVLKEVGDGASDETPPTRSRSGRLGGRAVLSRLFDDKFFASPKTINAIVEHAEANLATRLKQSDLSGPLARYVRERKLTRVKNTDDQYEYTQS